MSSARSTHRVSRLRKFTLISLVKKLAGRNNNAKDLANIDTYNEMKCVKKPSPSSSSLSLEDEQEPSSSSLISSYSGRRAARAIMFSTTLNSSYDTGLLLQSSRKSRIGIASSKISYRIMIDIGNFHSNGQGPWLTHEVGHLLVFT